MNRTALTVLLLWVGCHRESDTLDRRAKRIAAIGDSPGEIATLIAMGAGEHSWPGSLSPEAEQTTRCEAMKQFRYLAPSQPSRPISSAERRYSSSLDVYPTNQRIISLLDQSDPCITGGALSLVEIFPFPSLRGEFERQRIAQGLRALERVKSWHSDVVLDALATPDVAGFSDMLTVYASLSPARKREEVSSIRLGLDWLVRRTRHDGAEYAQRTALGEAIRSGALGEQLLTLLDGEPDSTVREYAWQAFAVAPRKISADKLRALAARETFNEAQQDADTALAALR